MSLSGSRRRPVVGPDRAALPEKTAEGLARKLEERIAAMGWPVGETVGSEPELVAEYGTSRAAFREAVRILEHHAIARMRRGPGGGLVVTEPDTSSVVRATALHLQYDEASLGQVFDARSTLELKTVELAAQRIDEKGIRRLREALRRDEELQRAGVHPGTHEIHLLIADLTGNPSLRLFLEVLTKLTVPPAQADERSSALRAEHEAIVEAIVSGDTLLARQHMLAHLTAMKGYFTERRTA
jgi:DNA-binding FadR family transcriptional regulator